MMTGSGLISWQKGAGMVSMLFFFAALLALADALRGGFKGEQSAIELIPDSSFAISGPLPPAVEKIADFVIEGQPGDGAVRLVPQAIFSGYWLGGSMWRGRILTAPSAQVGEYTLRVRGQSDDKQNPVLVFPVRIWADQAELNAHSPSRLIRLTGLNPFLIALALALCGFAAGCLNFYMGRLWQRHLALNRCGEIFRARPVEEGIEIRCEIQGIDIPPAGAPATVLRASGKVVCAARLLFSEKNEIVLLLEDGEVSPPVRPGDVVCLHPGETPGQEK